MFSQTSTELNLAFVATLVRPVKRSSHLRAEPTVSRVSAKDDVPYAV
jgi:hypothetical protein